MEVSFRSTKEFYLPSWSDKQDHFSFGHISSLLANDRVYILVYIRAAWDMKRFIVQLIDYINDTDVKIILLRLFRFQLTWNRAW